VRLLGVLPELSAVARGVKSHPRRSPCMNLVLKSGTMASVRRPWHLRETRFRLQACLPLLAGKET